ncbi:hypothetical protein Oweho_3197 [Owenweeksia hongkongensis DSM 17368]|uniref:Uncharacterized protein n=1 Tax=Owenweeksia hongkongensis (strain DSM 17368 / CIP 108786 / JCM 12287 / NRRL B-23963 / UST20020801) TaxID=926562 RepID=G8R3R1_OWEHD|nr:hypothetical protein [Owenweeksia hongkongensis]AEV34148.1 hypothetical protein Oweho_3197 [Owenweeksia hongkongensis DSM 17368]
MIGPAEYQTLIEEIVAACPKLKKGFVTIDDAHLGKFIKDFKAADDCPFLAAGLPSIDVKGSKDANIPFQVIVFFILKKVDYNNQKRSEEIPVYQECFEAWQQVNAYLANSTSCQLFANYDGTANADPEHNRAGCDGYSISFMLKDTM